MPLVYKYFDSTGQKYYLGGDKPEILIVSGFHGDEFEIVPILEKYITDYLREMPEFLLIPEVSPSAIQRKDRRNNDGVNINRVFVDDTKELEAKLVMDLVRKYHFQTVFSFHEEPTEASFYFYDSKSLEGTIFLNDFRKELINLGINLYNGIDDADPILRNKTVDGYIYDTCRNEKGTIDNWLVTKNIVERAVCVEIPKMIKDEQKEKIVDLFFRKFIFKNSSG